MITWTPAARAEWDRFVARPRPDLAASGADALEVLEDLRRHVEHEATTQGLQTLTAEDVRRLLTRFGPPEPVPEPASAPVSLASGPPRKPSLWLALLGVVLPALTLLIELTTGMCAATFFDPMPTIWHVLLAAFVPAANGVALNTILRHDARRRTALGWANAFAFGIALFYAVLFLPLLLPGLLTVVFWGWGLLPLSPLLAVVATVFIRNHLRRLGAGLDASLPGFWRGLALAVLAVALAEAPSWITRSALRLAVSDMAAEQQRGVAWLRALGDTDILLRECYGRTRGAQEMDLVAWLITGGPRVTPERAREVYYRVTGTPFNAVPAPRVRTARGAFAALDEWTWDNDQGGERVGGRVKGLGLHASRLDAVVEPDAAVGYWEWTLEFKNSSGQAREARAQILLPPGGVVSRLTLWVNGEEREAAFAGRAQTRQAYQEVAIRQRRDPVLVTTAGPDRVLMQCFPVPADGGLMRVRLGITAPLPLTAADAATLRWPCFVERNFTIAEDFRHALWVEGPGELRPFGPELHAEQPRPDFAAARGQVREDALANGVCQVRVARPAGVNRVWTADSRSGRGGYVAGTFTTARPFQPSRVVLVLDSSRSMAPALPDVAAALDDLPATAEIALVLAGDEPIVLAEATMLDDARRAALRSRVAALRAAGGRDNLPALTRAWELAAEKPDAAIVWVHATQPVLLSSAEALTQAFGRRPRGPRLFSVQTKPGPNRVLEQLDGVPAVQSVARRDGVAEDLRHLFQGWSADQATLRLELEHVGEQPAAEPGLREVSPHLARLWAATEARRLHAAKNTDAAVRLAAAYQLVTPASGAVVLETQEQYDRHGLHPADPTTVPAIPEPRTSSLLVFAAAVWLLLKRRRLRVV
jgi:hypothetical protein